MNDAVWVGGIAIICEVMALIFLLANQDASERALKEFTLIIVVGMMIFWGSFGVMGLFGMT